MFLSGLSARPDRFLIETCKKTEKMSTTALVIVAALAVISLYIFFTQRSFVALEEKMKNAFNQINVQMKSRWDAVTNLVEMTRQYTKYEHDTLADVVSKRNGSVSNASELAESEASLRSVVGRLNVVAEQYPQLGANTVFVKTMGDIKDYEEKVRLSRMVFNDCVTRMNMMVRQWPSSMVAAMLHFTTHDLLPEDQSVVNAPSVSDIFSK